MTFFTDMLLICFVVWVYSLGCARLQGAYQVCT